MQDRDVQNISTGATKYSCKTTYNNGEMQIFRTWYTLLDFIGILLFAVVFNGLWVGNGFIELLTSDREILLKLFALLFICVGVSAAYFCIASLLNKTIITINQKCIEVRHQPVPWPGNTEIERSKIVKLMVKEKHYWGSSKNKPKMSLQILALTMKAEPLKVLTGLKYRKQAEHIKQEMEACLGFESDAEFHD